MKNMFGFVNFIIGVSFMSLCLTTSYAQNINEAFTSMESSVKSKTIAWTLNEKEMKEKSGTCEWIAGKKKVHVSITETASLDEAGALLKQTMMKITAPAKSKLIGYGDEAYLYKMDSDETSMILIRQNNLFIFVRSSHLVHAQEFAKDIVGVTRNKDNNK